ncbi:MAG: hypothetical protein HY861_02065 [Chlamydiia bacterium]|nr:hypothetical protein [Chlamydiia bacterium]
MAAPHNVIPLAPPIPAPDPPPYHKDQDLLKIQDGFLHQLAERSRDLCERIKNMHDTINQATKYTWPTLYRQQFIPLTKELVDHAEAAKTWENHQVTWQGTAEAHAKEHSTFKLAHEFFKQQFRALAFDVFTAAEKGLHFHLSDKPKYGAFAESFGTMTMPLADWADQNKWYGFSAALGATGITHLLYAHQPTNEWILTPFTRFGSILLNLPLLAGSYTHSFLCGKEPLDTCTLLPPKIGTVMLGVAALYPTFKLIEPHARQFFDDVYNVIHWMSEEHRVLQVQLGSALTAAAVFTTGLGVWALQNRDHTLLTDNLSTMGITAAVAGFFTPYICLILKDVCDSFQSPAPAAARP